MLKIYLENIFWQKIELPLRKIWCFIVGHKAKYGGAWEEDWCKRCLVDWPTEKVVISTFLNRVYCWAVEHGWPEAIDLWLMKHINLPSWWEY